MSGTGEQLSAFLDGELDSIESDLFVRRLGKDNALRETSLSYTLIGDAMRDDVLSEDPRAISRTVRAQASDDISQVAISRTAGSRWLRPIAGAAVAASVAVVAVLSLQQTTVDELEAPVVTVPLAVIDGVAAPSTYTVPAVISRRAGSSPDRLSEYYLNHSEYATMLRGQGSLVRIVTTPGPESEDAEEVAEAADDATEENTAR